MKKTITSRRPTNCCREAFRTLVEVTHLQDPYPGILDEMICCGISLVVTIRPGADGTDPEDINLSFLELPSDLSGVQRELLFDHLEIAAQRFVITQIRDSNDEPQSPVPVSTESGDFT